LSKKSICRRLINQNLIKLQYFTIISTAFILFNLLFGIDKLQVYHPKIATGRAAAEFFLTMGQPFEGG
jgi:hypothetical protein